MNSSQTTQREPSRSKRDSVQRFLAFFLPMTPFWLAALQPILRFGSTGPTLLVPVFAMPLLALALTRVPAARARPLLWSVGLGYLLTVSLHAVAIVLVRQPLDLALMIAGLILGTWLVGLLLGLAALRFGWVRT